MDVFATRGAGGKTAELAEPRQGALDHPAVAAQSLARLDSFPGDADCDVPPSECAPKARDVERLVGVPVGGARAALSGGPSDRGMASSRVSTTVLSCRLAPLRQTASGVPDRSTTRWRFVPGTLWVLPQFVGSGPIAPPPLYWKPSRASATRLQSMRSASPSRSRRSRWSRSHTPACCHAQRAPGNRRQQVIPKPHPGSWGRYSQGRPDLSTKTMPVRHARSGTRGRPPFGFGGSGESSGSMMFQRSSETIGLLMPARTPSLVPRF